MLYPILENPSTLSNKIRRITKSSNWAIQNDHGTSNYINQWSKLQMTKSTKHKTGRSIHNVLFKFVENTKSQRIIKIIIQQFELDKTNIG